MVIRSARKKPRARSGSPERRKRAARLGRTLLRCGLIAAGSALAGCPQMLSDGFSMTSPGAGGAGGNVLLSNAGEAGDDTGAAGLSNPAGSSNAGASGTDASGGAAAGASGMDASGGAAAATGGASGASNAGTDSGGASATPPPPTGSAGAGSSPSSSCPFGAPELITGLGLSGSSWAPAISADGLSLYLSNDSAGSEDVYRASRSDRGAVFSPAVALSAINTSSDDGAPCPSADGLTLYFYSTRSGGVGARDLYAASRATLQDEFGNPALLGNVNSGANDHLPRISADGLTLMFSSARAGSGDLWVASRASTSDGFGTALSLPGSINTTSAAESSGGVSSDGLRLYFDSNRADGAGGYDIYVATRASTSDPFANPVALSVLNTAAADYNVFVSADDQELFFSSNRVSSATYQLYRSLRTCP